VRSQEHAFRAYYASMSDADLLQTAANRSSFIAIAQRILADELRKRELTPLPGPALPVRHSAFWTWADHLAKLTSRLHRPRHPVPS